LLRKIWGPMAGVEMGMELAASVTRLGLNGRKSVGGKRIF
jgi:hypothetical protein